MQINQRKNLTTVQGERIAPVMPEVHASQHVLAKRRDVSGIVQALSGIGAKAIGDHREAKNTADAARGQRDELMGVDTDLDQQTKAYRTGRLRQRTTADGLEWFNRVRESLGTRMVDDPDMDYAAFKQEAMAEFLTGREDPESIKVANAMSGRLLESLDAMYYNARSKIDLAESEADLDRTVIAAVQAGAVKSAADVEGLIAQADDLVGIDRKTARKRVVDALAPMIASGRTELVEALRPHLSDDVDLDNLLTRAKTQGEAEIARAEAEARAERARNDLQFWRGVERKIHNGQSVLGEMQFAVANGYATASQAANWEGQSLRRSEALVAKAEAAAEKAREEKLLRDHLLNGTGMVVNATEARKLLDGEFANAFVALENTADGENPEAQQEAISMFRGIVELSKLNGYAPTGLENYFRSVDYSSPTRFKRVGEAFLALRRDGQEDYLRAHLPARDIARLSHYATARENGETPEQVSQHMTHSAQVPTEQAAAMLGQNSRDVDRAVQSLTRGSPQGYGLAKRLLEESAHVYLTMGYSPREAIKRATDDTKKSTVKFGNALVPANTVSGPETGRLASQYIHNIVLPTERTERPGGFDAASDLQFLPLPNSDGAFMLMDTGAKAPYLDKDGGTVVMTEAEMRARLTENRQESNRRQRALTGATDRDEAWISAGSNMGGRITD